MKIIASLLTVPLIFIFTLTSIAGGLSLYRGMILEDARMISEGAAGFGLNCFLLVLAGLLFRRIGGPKKARSSRPTLGTRSLRLNTVGSTPKIALF